MPAFFSVVSVLVSLLDRSDRPTALFAESDEMAYGAILAIRRAGLRVPQDVPVVGFDDHASAWLLDLSTMRQPVIEQAEDLTARPLTTIDEPAPTRSCGSCRPS